MTVNYSLQQVFDAAHACLMANGCDDANASAIADNMRRAEADGSTSHGLFRLLGYVATLKSGKVDGHARPDISRAEHAPGVVRVAGNGGFAPLILQTATPELIATARQQGIAAMAVTGAHHFSSLWVDIEPLTDAGLCALACTAYMPSVAPVGGNTPLFGTNPIAFGWPRKNAPAMIFDQATTAMARGEIMLAARDGKQVPPGVGLTKDGEPTTDPNEILSGVMLPFGGYKGSAIAMMVELLAAGLIGEAFSYEAKERDNGDGGPPRGGVFMLAMDPSRFGDPGWADHSEAFFARLTAIDGVRLPGQRRMANRERTIRTGIELPEKLHEQIAELTRG